MAVVLLLVLLAVAGGVAYLTITFRRWVRQGDQLGGRLSGQVFSVGNELGGRLSLARAERDQLRERVDQLDTTLGDLKDALARIAAAQEAGQQRDQWAADELVAMARQVEALARSQEGILSYLRSTLADEAVAGAGDHRRQVVAASVRSAQSQDLLQGLLADLCEALGLKPVLPDRAGQPASVSYYAAPAAAGQPAAVTLAALLAAVPQEDAAASPGLDELRRLLIVLRSEGPGIVQLGPVILTSTPSALLGYVTAPSPDPSEPGAVEPTGASERTSHPVRVTPQAGEGAEDRRPTARPGVPGPDAGVREGLASERVPNQFVPGQLAPQQSASGMPGPAAADLETTSDMERPVSAGAASEQFAPKELAPGPSAPQQPGPVVPDPRAIPHTERPDSEELASSLPGLALPLAVPLASAAQSAAECGAWLQGREDGQVVDLTAWAAGYLA